MDAKPAGNPAAALLLGLLGAGLGGALGYFVFGWLARQGFYALAIPGAMLGGGCGLLLKHRSQTAAALCGVGALMLGVFSEWRLFPFVKDKSLGYFLSHLDQLRPFTLIMIALGGVLGYWLALRARAR